MPTVAQQLRAESAAVRIAFTWFGVRKALTVDQQSEAAEAFAADKTYLSSRKKLLDTKHKAYRSVTGVRSDIRDYWKGTTLPFPEPGIRLMRRSEMGTFEGRMRAYKDRLSDAVADLEKVYSTLKDQAREHLGRLFSSTDYPHSLLGLFDVQWDYPSVEPPAYLATLAPDLYEQEQQRVAARFEQAASLAETAFAEEFEKLIRHLSDKLTSTAPDGTRHVFRDSAVSNLGEFFERFKSIGIRSNAQLDALVAQAQELMKGVEPKELRTDETLRAEIATGLGTLTQQLDSLMVATPRRRIIGINRPVAAPAESPAQAAPETTPTPQNLFAAPAAEVA
jgi:hypothetical protein